MSVPVLQDQLLGRQIPSPSPNAWERSEGGCAGCRQYCSILLCNGLIKVGKGESV